MISEIKELKFPTIGGKQYATLTQATAELVDMGEKNITAQIKIDGDIIPDFTEKWEVEFKGEKYIMPLREPQGAKGNESSKTTIDLTFQHWAIYQLKRWMFFTVQTVNTGTAIPDKYEADVNLNLGDFCKLFAQVLQYYYGETITIALNPNWIYKSEPTRISLSKTYIWDVLIQFYELFAVRWQIEPATTNSNTETHGERYVIKVGYPTTEVDHIFEYGFEGGLLKIERQTQDDDIRNILIGRGSEENIPYRYFKDKDSQNPDFIADPDWIPELANIYFDRLRGATFRSYVQGWKAKHYNGTTTQAQAYSQWAWIKGYTDLQFDPVEYVADEITTNPSDGDIAVSIAKDYAPFVKKDSSLHRYGPLFGAADDNDDARPTIQGVDSADHLNFFSTDIGRIDQVVDVDQVATDDIESATEAKAQLYDLPGGTSWNPYVYSGQTISLVLIEDEPFSIGKGLVANLETKDVVLQGIIGYKDGSRGNFTNHVQHIKTEIKVTTKDKSQVVPSVGIGEGDYFYSITVTLKNNYSEPIEMGASIPGVVMTTSALSERWASTFNIWIKNIWATKISTSETPTEYATRVWGPILGDHLGNEAKVMFSSGALAASEDYEFVITKVPEYDISKTITNTEDGVSKTVQSHWKLTLAKSDADMESLGVYIPSTQRQGKAGDHFLFTGIDHPHAYTVWAEEDIDNQKKALLETESKGNPTFVVSTDRVRLNEGGKPNALINQLHVGNSLRLSDKRLIQPLGDRAYEIFYLQSITYTYREPTSSDAALNPDVSITLSNKYASTASPVSVIQGELSSIQRQLGAISNIEQIVRAVGDKLYLRKDGISDRSLSPTEFVSLLSSYGFRQGMLGGTGWGFFRDANGAWVLETDKINVRQDLQVNNLVINQIEARGGMIVESAAAMEISRVVKDSNGDYVCYFDQKEGTIANLFRNGDIAYCSRFSSDLSDILRTYKREVVGLNPDCVILDGSNTEMDAPIVGDVIVQWGSTSDPTRRYVIVRDVVNGGYERFIEDLNGVDATGTEYFFIGRQAGMYNNRPRFFIGDNDGYIEYKNGVLNIKARLNAQSTIDGTAIGDYVKEAIGTISAPIIDLTNEVQGLACDSSGAVVSGLPATTTVHVYENGIIQPGWTITISTSGCTANLNQSTGAITITSILNSATTASVAITASKNGYEDLHATFSLYKVIPGANGESPILYELGVSPTNITKDANGTLSSKLVTVTKYKTDSTGKNATTDMWLRYSYEGTSQLNILASSHGGTNKIDLGPIPSTATALVVTLYDDNNINTAKVLDRERVPILTDASGLLVGGTNLARNTNQGTRGWKLAFPARSGEVDSETGEPIKSIGEFSMFKSTTSKGVLFVNQAETTETGWQLPYFDISSDMLKYGTPYMLSFKARATIIPAQLRIDLRHFAQGGSLANVTILDLTTEETRYEVPIRLDRTPTADLQYSLCFYIISSIVWSEIEIWDLKFEIGNIATEWSPSPLDFDYLTQALEESTVIDGGLVLSSVIKVGTNSDADTLEQTTMAGISGIVNTNANARGGIAIWAGGDMCDIGDPDRDANVTPATIVIRHDGSAYFAKNTIRFAQDVVEVGDSVILNDDGLVLNDSNGTQRLKIANTSVGDDIDIDAANIAITSNTTLNVQLQKKSGQTQIFTPGVNGLPGTIDVITTYWWEVVGGTTSYTYKIPGELTPGATLTLQNCSIEIDVFQSGETLLPLKGTAEIRVGYYEADGNKKYLPQDTGQSISFKKNSSSNYVATLNSLYIPAANISGGSYFVEWKINTKAKDDTGTIRAKSALLTINGTAYNTFDSTTILGSDGLLSIWDKTGLLINKDKVVMRCGNTILRIGSQGIQKSVNGGASWTSL